MSDTKPIVRRIEVDSMVSDFMCRADDVALLEQAFRDVVTALNRACRHDDPDNSGLCIKCGVVLEYDGPLSLVDDGIDWAEWRSHH
jgi:hypothetical protein